MDSRKTQTPLVFLCCLLVLTGLAEISGIVAQSSLDSPFGTDELVKLLALQQSGSSFPEQTQHKQQALTDHTNDEIFKSTSQQIIERSGFKQVTHYVTSKDGYKTELINVIDPCADQSQLKQPPVMIFHGGTADSSTYLESSAIQHHPEKYPRTAADGPITSSNRSLGMMLTNYGFNVWLVATRGSNRQNIGHTTLRTKLLEDILLDPTDPDAIREVIDTIRYYGYSQDELVELEYPAQIAAVLNLTGSSKVSTITYSFSTQIMFKLLASNKAMAEKIHTNVALAPILNRIGTSAQNNAMLDLLLAVPDPIGNLLQQLIFSQFTRDFVRSLDRYRVTYEIFNSMDGISPKYQTFLEDPVIGHLFLPTSFTEIKHFSQQTRVGKLQKYDHGPAKNLELYGQINPPVYRLEDIKIERWMLVSGDTDILGTINSGDTYAAQLPNRPYKYIRLVNGWNHIDMANAFENDVKINLHIVDFLDHFSSLGAT